MYRFCFLDYVIYRLADCLDLVLHQAIELQIPQKEEKKTYSALDSNDASRAKVKISRVQSESLWYLAPSLLDSIRRLVGPFDQIPEIVGRRETHARRACRPWPDIRKGRLGDGGVGELDCRMVQQDTAWRGRQGRAVDEVEMGGGLGGGHEGEGGEEAGEVVLRGGVVCGELEAGDGCSYAEEDGAETFWALEYVGGVCVADVPVLETGGLHEEAEGAGGGGHRGGGRGGGGGESPRKHVNKAPRLASPPFPLSLSPPRASTPHPTAAPQPCPPPSTHTPPRRPRPQQNTPPPPQTRESRRSASASIPASSSQREAGPRGDARRPHSLSRGNR